MGSTITEFNYSDTSRRFLRNNPVTVYAGVFSNLVSYKAGDVVVFGGKLFLSIVNTPVSVTPVGNPNFIAYDLEIGSLIRFNMDTSIDLEPGNYELVLQGGGGSGSIMQNNVTRSGGGGGGSGYITYFDFKPVKITTLSIVIGQGGTGGFFMENDGIPTVVNFVSPNGFLSSFSAAGGSRGINGNGGAGGYGGGGAQIQSGNTLGGTSQQSISAGGIGTTTLGGTGAFSSAFVALGGTGSNFSGGGGGGQGAGSGGTISPLFVASSALPNSGAGGGGSSINSSLIPTPNLISGSGGSGWVTILRKR